MHVKILELMGKHFYHTIHLLAIFYILGSCYSRIFFAPIVGEGDYLFYLLFTFLSIS